MLIAIATPSCSFFFICKPQTTFHGKKASVMSIAAEYAAGYQQGGTHLTLYLGGLLPAENILYLTMVPAGQHVPGMDMFQPFCTGVHWTQGNNADSPIATFIEMMRHQMRIFMRPSVNRSRVMAKLVFDQMAAVTEKVPATRMTLSSCAMLCISKSQTCRP